jgi:hypothetical protein
LVPLSIVYGFKGSGFWVQGSKVLGSGLNSEPQINEPQPAMSPSVVSSGLEPVESSRVGDVLSSAILLGFADNTKMVGQ